MTILRPATGPPARDRRRRPAVLVLLAVLAVGACGASRSALPPSSAGGVATTTPPGPVPTAAATTTVPPTTTTAPPPPYPVPRALTPLVAPALPGEGVWAPAGPHRRRGWAVYTTELRPGPGAPPAGVAWIDTAAVRLALFAGLGEPEGTWPDEAAVPAAQQPSLLAAFNAGFRVASYRTGWYEAGRTAEPLQDGAASLVIDVDGRATVGEWGRDVTLTPAVAAVRQNLSLLVDGGAPTPQVATADWGAVLGGGTVAWRSGVGVTARGDLVYVAGPELTPAALAGLLVDAGARRAMELDINPEWVSFAAFTHTGGVTQGTNLLPDMYQAPGHYLVPYTRDFFAVFAR